MKPLNDFAHKQSKYMPTFAKATGKPTVYIPGYPYQDEEQMPATGFHGEQSSSLYEQISSYFAAQPHIYVGIDNFIYYREGDLTKSVAPDIYVVLGAAKFPLRRSFYTWAEGATPTVVLSSYRIQQPMKIETKRFISTYGIWAYKNTSSINLRWRNLLNFAGGGWSLQALLLR